MKHDMYIIVCKTYMHNKEMNDIKHQGINGIRLLSKF
jgi:hypothetical protein